MTDYKTEVTAVRRLLKDNPLLDYVTANVASGSAGDELAITVNDGTKFRAGQRWEFDDAAASATSTERVQVRSVSGNAVTVLRGIEGSTVSAHTGAAGTGARLLLEPRFSYDETCQALDTTIDSQLFPDVYDIVEHQVTSSSSTNAYNAPTANCEEFLQVYQQIASTDPPLYDALAWDRLPQNVDTALWASGKVFKIYGNYGTPGVATYYVNCKHRLTMTTLTQPTIRGVEFLACAYLLEWEEARRLAGPTNQGDRTVPPGATLPTANYYRSQGLEVLQDQAAYLDRLTPNRRSFRRY